MKTEKIYFVKRKSTNLNNRFPKPKHIKSVNNKEHIVKEEAYSEPIKPKLDFANSILSQVISKPVKEKTITALVSVKYAPLKVKVGEIIKPSDVIINVNYSDGSSGKIASTMVLCDTSVKGPAEAQVYYNEFGPIIFNVVVD